MVIYNANRKYLIYFPNFKLTNFKVTNSKRRLVENPCYALKFRGTEISGYHSFASASAVQLLKFGGKGE